MIYFSENRVPLRVFRFLSFDKRVLEVVKTFHERRIDRLTVYVEGFGGLFLSRVKDGFVIGYIDKNKRFGIDDHVTVFYGEKGLEGLHSARLRSRFQSEIHRARWVG
jgi:hypothetical protein